MNQRTTSPAKLALGLAVLGSLSLAPAARATVAVLSNIATEQEALGLVDSDGVALPTGSQAVLGTFAGISDAQIQSAAAAGPAELLRLFDPHGEPLSIGGGSISQPGVIESFASEPIQSTASPAGEVLHLIVGNAPTLEMATELLVLNFPTSLLAADYPGGIEAYVSAHVRDASVNFGTTGPAGLHTATTRSYEGWAAYHLPGAAPDDLSPGGNPDLDELTNIFEFSQGSDPADGSASGNGFTVEIEAGISYAVFNRRLLEPALSYQVEVYSTGQSEWQPVTSTIEILTSADPAPPPGYERVRQPLPSPEQELARLIVTYSR
ncbi:MAG: hypothetical protein ACR2RV_20925 [Verrucomicrobiales bacterium]